MKSLPKSLELKLIERNAENALRYLPEQGKELDFSSNDFLGFAKSEALFEATLSLLKRSGQTHLGATGSRLLSGNNPLYAKLESDICRLHEAEAALVFNSGYDANVGVFAALPQRNDVVLYDAYCHASIREGIRLSPAKAFKFSHNDLDDLKQKLQLHATTKGALYVAVESVYSMDGDVPDLAAMQPLMEQYGGRLIVDEAHATGVIGQRGEGLVQSLELQSKIFARIHTFGKGLGCHGAAVLGSTDLKAFLVNFAKSLIYTTALSPFSLASAINAYDMLPSTGAVAQLTKLISHFRKEVDSKQLTSHFIESHSAIHTCIVPGNERVKAISKILAESGFDVKAILHPTVPKNEERLRICLHSFNEASDISKILNIIADFMRPTPSE